MSAASGSAQMLNSAVAVTFPPTAAPPMMVSPLSRSGSVASRCSASAMVGERPNGHEVKVFDAMAGFEDEPDSVIGFDGPGDRGQFHVAESGGTVYVPRSSGFVDQRMRRTSVYVNVEVGDLGYRQSVAGGVLDPHVSVDSGDPDQLRKMRRGQQGNSVVKPGVTIHQHRNTSHIPTLLEPTPIASSVLSRVSMAPVVGVAQFHTQTTQ